MFKNLLLSVLLLLGTLTVTYSQITCPPTLTVVIGGSVTGSPLSVIGTPTQPLCNNLTGDLTGAISLAVEGGTAPYSYNWTMDPDTDTFSTDMNLSELGTGTYSVTVTDDVGCEIFGSWDILEPSIITVDGDLTNLLCNSASGDADGAIDITAGGGSSGTYTYNWEAITPGATGIVAADEDQTQLSAGVFQVTVTDEFGCTAVADFELNEPDAIATTSNVTHPVCHVDSDGGNPLGAIVLLVQGGDGNFTYTWAESNGASGVIPGDQNQSGLSAGTYSLTISDTFGCELEVEFNLESPDPVIVAGDIADVICNSASGDPSGEIDITPDGGQGTVGGAISSEGDYTYLWTTVDGSGLNPTDADQTQLSAGTYTVVVTDSQGCTVTADYEISEPVPFVAAGSQVDLICHADNVLVPTGSITMAPEDGVGPYTYTWATVDGGGMVPGDGGNQTDLNAGTYTVTVVDGSGCSAENSFTLTQPAAPVFAFGVETQLQCNSASGSPTGAIDMTPTGGDGNYSYQWSTDVGSGLDAGAEDQTALSAGVYTVTVTDGVGCSNIAVFTLDEPAAISCSLDSDFLGTDGTNLLCFNDEGVITVTASGGTPDLNYTLNGTDYLGATVAIGPQASTDFTGLLAGTYTVTTSDLYGCSTTCDYTLTQPEELIAGTCTTDDECQVDQGEINVQVAGGFGPYTITWTSPTVGATLDQASQVITTQGGGAVIFTGAQGGATYIFTVTDENGCIIGG